MESKRQYGLGGYGRGRPISTPTRATPGNPTFDDRDDVFLNSNARDTTPVVEVESKYLHGPYRPVQNLRKSMTTSSQDVTVTYVENPNYFCFQTCHQAKWVKKNEKYIHETIVDGGDNLKMTPNFNYKRVPCAVFYHGMWRRGFVFRVKNWNENPTSARDYIADITLVDYGNCGLVRMTEMKKLPPQLLKIPPMAYRGRLEGFYIEGIELCGLKWPADLLKKCRDMMMTELPVLCKFTTADDGAPSVILRDVDHRCPLCKTCKEGICSVNVRIERLLEKRFGPAHPNAGPPSPE